MTSTCMILAPFSRVSQPPYPRTTPPLHTPCSTSEGFYNDFDIILTPPPRRFSSANATTTVPCRGCMLRWPMLFLLRYLVHFRLCCVQKWGIRRGWPSCAPTRRSSSGKVTSVFFLLFSTLSRAHFQALLRSSPAARRLLHCSLSTLRLP